MQTKSLKKATAAVSFIIITALIFSGCQKDVANNQKLQSQNSSDENAIAAKASHAPYNLDVVLYGPGNNGGFIRFRQNKDTAKIIDLNTWAGNLRPNHAYLLQRAVNPITDTTGCSSTSWLTLGEGLVPQSIVTDADGNGNEDLWRDISAVASGTQFYIHFQVVDSLNLKVALTSGCYTYTVR